MELAAKIAGGVVAVILLILGARYMFTPSAVQGFIALTPESAFGTSNIRAMGAPLLMLGIVTAIGTVKASHEFLTPAPVYFLLLILSRIVTLVMDGSDPSVIRALILAVVFFVVSEFAVQVVKRSANTAPAAT